MIRHFLDTRADISTKSTVKSYPAESIPRLVERFFYWPGLREILPVFSRDKLKKIGIPLINPNKDTSTWDSSGVIMKLGKGYKLCFYQKRYCKGAGKLCDKNDFCPDFREKGSCFGSEKRGSKGCKTFPMPGEIDTSKPVVLVEGEIDALAAAAMGIENIFSTGGTNALTKPLILKYLMDAPEIILCFDADEAGRKASGIEALEENDKRRSNIPQTISQAGYTGKVRIAELPPKEEAGGKDPDELILKGRIDTLKQAIAEAKEYDDQTPPHAARKKQQARFGRHTNP